MDEHITKWLDAYHDGELRGRRLAQVEAHLEWCAQCQADLEALDSLSRLLHGEPGPVDLTSAERFVTQVELQLPREQAPKTWRGRMAGNGWLIIPILLAGVWIILQTVGGVSLFVSRLGLDLGLFAAPADCVNGVFNQQAAVQIVSCSAGAITRQALVWAVGLLYTSWLAIWWVTQSRQTNEEAS